MVSSTPLPHSRSDPCPRYASLVCWTPSPALPLTPGIALYSFHKYQKSLAASVTIDAAGNPIAVIDEDDERAPLRARAYSSTRHSRTGSRASHATHISRGSIASHVSHVETPVGVQMHELASSRASRISTAEDEEDRAVRLRDDFEGWDAAGGDGDVESELDDDEVAQYRTERVSRWKAFWAASM